MATFYFGDIKLPVHKCKRPKMTSHFGRTWDFGYILIDNEKTKAWVDTTWGHNMFFIVGEQWYKVALYSGAFKLPAYDIDIFSTNMKVILTTQI